MSISDSARVESVCSNCDTTPAVVVRNPNSVFNWRCTGTRVTASMNGILPWGPGSVVRTYLPNRCTTPTSSALTW